MSSRHGEFTDQREIADSWRGPGGVDQVLEAKRHLWRVVVLQGALNGPLEPPSGEPLRVLEFDLAPAAPWTASTRIGVRE